MSKFLQAQVSQSQSSSSSDNDSSSNSSSDNEQEQQKKVQQTKKQQSKQPEKKSKFQAVQSDNSDSEKSDSEKEQKQDKKSKQNTKPQKSKFQVQQDQSDNSENSDSEQEQQKQKKQKEQPKQQEKKKFLTKEEKKKLKQQKQEEEEEDIDAILNAAIEEKKKQEEQLKKQQEQQKSENKPENDEENKKEEKGDNQQKSKAQLKREKKKQKEKEQKEAGTNENQQQEQQENNESKASKNKKKKGGAKPTSKIAEMILQQQKQKEEEEKAQKEALRKAQEEEEARIAAEEAAEAERQRLKKEEKERKKKNGEILSKAEKKKKEKLEKARQQLLRQQELQQKLAEQQIQKQSDKEQKEKDEAEKQQKLKEEKLKKIQQQQNQLTNKDKKQSEDSALENWEDFEEVEQQEQIKKEQLEQLQKEKEELEMKRKNSNGKKKKKKSWEYLEGIPNDSIYQNKAPEKGVLRSPIIVIMGHVDTGKTTLLDKLRHTNVQGGEAGGITQQIGATFFPQDKVVEQTKKVQELYKTEFKAPGLLVIDTPGHESFANLRSRGSSLCDFAILVIDLMHGLEQQTMESIKLLTMRKTPFVIALNKIDRCYDWKSKPYEPSQMQISKQKRNTQQDFETRYQKVITQLAKIEKNAILYWQNEDIKSFFPVVPTSGVTGEGIPDLLAVITKYTSQFMKSKMMVKEDAFNCTVMEVKVIEGHGTTIDCILIDGFIKKGDTITILGFNGPITTKIRALLTPHPMKEMRVKGEYIQHDIIYAAMGLKIAAKGLEEAVAGCQLIVSKTQEEIHKAETLIAKELDAVKQKIQLSNQGVGVAASTLGSLEALLSFLKESNIPVSYVTIGPVSKDDINKAMKALLADDVESRKKEYAVMLVFDIKVLKEAAAYAEEQGVKIFTANIIYHLQDQYIEYYRKCIEDRKQQNIKDSIFPCELSIVKIFRMNKPLILGVKVVTGQLRVGTPLVADIDGKPVKIGVVDSMESNGKPVKNGIIKPENGETAVKINEAEKVKGGQTFTEEHKLYSLISRHSIDCLKEYFRDDVSKQEWKFIQKTLKPYFNIY